MSSPQRVGDPPGRAPRGLSLAEIVVSGFLALLALVSLLAPLQSSHRSAQQSHSRLEALRIASDLISLSRSLPLNEVTGSAGSRALESVDGVRFYHYRVDVANPSPHFRQVRVQVRWQEYGRLQLLEYGTCLQGEVP